MGVRRLRKEKPIPAEPEKKIPLHSAHAFIKWAVTVHVFEDTASQTASNRGVQKFAQFIKRKPSNHDASRSY